MKDVHKGQLFKDIVTALQQSGHKMCVLHGYKSYPERIGWDVDVISENPAQITHIISEQKVATVVQAIPINIMTNTHVSYRRYIFYKQYDGEPVFLTLDASVDYGYYGRVFFSGEEFLRTCRPFKFFKVPSAELEFAAYLSRKIVKRSLNEVQSQWLTECYEEDRAGCERQLKRLLPEAETKLIVRSARSGNWDPVRSRIEHLRRELLKKTGREQPLRVLLHTPNISWRRLKRILWPSGLMVAFVGVDGSGKSPVLTRVARDLSPAFLYNTKSYHTRTFHSALRWMKRFRSQPLSGERKDEGVTGHDPHAHSPRKLLASLAKLGFWWLDYTLLGYIVEIHPSLARGTLALFDRHYYDLLVDTKRYRYGGPLWLARVVGRFIPHPHLVILLDAPPEVLYARKQEISYEEVTRQREAYLELVRSLPNGHVIDTSKPLDEAVARAEQIILDYMAERTTRRLQIQP